MTMGHYIQLKENNVGYAWMKVALNWNTSSPWMKELLSIKDIHGHCGSRGVIQKLQDTLSTLTSMGYDPDISKIKVNRWGDAKQNSGVLTRATLQKHKGHMVTCYVWEMLTLACKYPYAYWYSDQVVGSILPLYGYIGEEEEENKEDD